MWVKSARVRLASGNVRGGLRMREGGDVTSFFDN